MIIGRVDAMGGRLRAILRAMVLGAAWLGSADGASAGGDGPPEGPFALDLGVVDPDLSAPTAHELVIGASRLSQADFVTGATLLRQRENTVWAPYVHLDEEGRARLVTSEDWDLPPSPPGAPLYPVDDWSTVLEVIQ